MTTIPQAPDLDTLPDTPAGQQVKWFFSHSFARGEGLTVEEIADHMVFNRGGTPEGGLQRFRQSDERSFRVTRVKEDSPHSISVTADYDDGKPWVMTFTVEEAPPHRIANMFWSRAIPDDVVIREATTEDGPALNDLEVRAPMELGDVVITYDRGEDFLGFARLMENNLSWVADAGGRLLGFAGGAMHPVRIGGRVYQVMLLHHVRVPIEARGGGIFSAINQRVFAAHPTQEGAYGHTALANEEGLRLGGPGAWSFGFFRAVIDCDEVAGPPHGRPATPADAPEIVEILNTCHDREEVFLPYTVESLTARLQRAPELYTWDQLLMGDGTVVGVWPAGVKVTVERKDGERTEAVRGVVLDYGFVPDAEDEFERLLRAWCGRLVDMGHTEVSMLASEVSPNYRLARDLAKGTDPYAFRMGVPEPEGAADRGLYIDAVYF